MANRYAWFSTVHLWEQFQHWSVRPSRGGDMDHLGTTRERSLLVPTSPNFKRTIDVVCMVGPASAYGSYDSGTVAELQIRTTEQALFALGKDKYVLKWTDDYNGGGGVVACSLSDCVFVEMSAEPPDYDGAQLRRVTYTFVSQGTFTIGSIAAFGATPL